MNSIRCRQCEHYIEANAGEGKIYGCDRSKCVFEPTTKNNLGADCISRADAIQAMQDKAKKLTNEDTINGLCGAVAILFELPSITPQEPTDKKFTKADIDAIVKAINEGWELRVNEILDKIRAEIETCLKALDEIEKSGLNIYLPNEMSGRRLTYQQCLEFIDKYKAEDNS